MSRQPVAISSVKDSSRPEVSKVRSFSSFLSEFQGPELRRPPRKRQKLSHGLTSVDGNTSEGHSANQTACLVDLSFNLVEEAKLEDTNISAEVETIPVTVQAVQLSQEAENAFRVDLRHSEARPGTEIELLFQSRNQDNGDVQRVLTDVVKLSKNGSKQKNSERISAETLLKKTNSIDQHQWILSVRLFWNIGGQPLSDREHTSVAAWLAAYFPKGKPQVQKSWESSQQAFYDSAHVPDANETPSADLFRGTIDCNLFPFQRRTISWMLQRENAQLGPNGVVSKLTTNSVSFDESFSKVRDAEGQECFVNHLFGTVHESKYVNELARPQDVQGGILAEEMGLGKTVELATLVSLHRRNEDTAVPDANTHLNARLRSSGATLIITPQHILEQWKTELGVHAPHLSVYHYKGTGIYSKESHRPSLNENDYLDELLKHDIVLSTYDTLSKDIHFAKESPQRSLRNPKQYEARRSPLVMIHWWRVCLDEAQMIESGVSNAAQVARLIPRCNAWAVTGTPLRKSVDDLRGLLTFLKLDPYCYKSVFGRMVLDFRHIFISLFSAITLRHTKADIQDELVLPPQNRFVISMPFTAIEEQHYAELFQTMCQDCGLDEKGGPLRGDWDPDAVNVIEKMGSWLNRLRQTCLHPEVGGKNRRALGQKLGPLRTVTEVLDVMIEQNETNLRLQERQALSARLMRGHLVYWGKEFLQASIVYQETLDSASTAVTSCREQILIEQGNVESEASRKLEEDQKSGLERNSGSDEKDEKTERSTARMARLRLALEIQHASYFFLGTAYYSLKKVQEAISDQSEEWKALDEQESDAYEKAKVIRQELLSDISERTRQRINQVEDLQKGKFVPIKEIQTWSDFSGIQSRRVIDKIDELIKRLNKNGAILSQWRSKLTDLLLMKLLDQDDDAALNGEEYESSTKVQDEQYVYVFALRVSVADRAMIVTGNGQVNDLIRHEVNYAVDFANDGNGHAPELMLSTLKERGATLGLNDKPKTGARGLIEEPLSIRGLMSEIRSMITLVRAREESQILEIEWRNLQRLMSIETKAISSLENEVDLYTTTMNLRLEFYRQLQAISDTVAPLQEEPSESVDTAKVTQTYKDEARHLDAHANLATKRRYLEHLKRESSTQEDRGPRECIICQSNFENGLLTVCGHIACKECMEIWRRERHNCPTCKRHLKASEMHAITYKPKEIQARKEHHQLTSRKPDETPTKAFPIYSNINTNELDNIKDIDLRGSYGTKIDTLARHLIWLRENRPGTQSVVFSQYRDFLNILRDAFRHFKISFVEAGNATAKKNPSQQFKENSNIECFLLHAKANSSGLTLVNATNVFICEPLINPAIELQAIARVHRIGQTRATTVWMYLVSNTVEEAIYEISVDRRLSHIQSKQPKAGTTTTRSAPLAESTLDIANSMELQANPIADLLAKGKSGGEVVPKEDLWQCLFRKRKS